jgi:hypothetical protein
MLIEHTTKRLNGSVHSIGGVKYHFKPNADGAHVAEVENPAHIQRFLSIPSFSVYVPDADAATTAPAAQTLPPRDPDTVGGIGDAGPRGGDDSTNTGDEGKGDDEDDEDAPVVTPLEEAPDEVLDQLYEAAYGKKPHHKFSREKIIDMIRKAPAREAE